MIIVINNVIDDHTARLCSLACFMAIDQKIKEGETKLIQIKYMLDVNTIKVIRDKNETLISEFVEKYNVIDKHLAYTHEGDNNEDK